jgi:hypothetical protein
LADYDVTTTLGTGTKSNNRVLWKSQTSEEQEDRRVLCHEDTQKG